MDEEQQQIIAVLQRIPLFDSLDDDQLAEFAGHFARIVLPRNTVIYLQKSPPDSFYIVFNGKVRLTRWEKKAERLISIIGPADFFGEQGLIYNKPHSSTVTTIERTTLYRMNRDDFYNLLAGFPILYGLLTIVAESRKLAYKQKFDFVRPDEIFYFLSRKHPFILLVSLLLPGLLFLLSLLVIGIAALQYTFPAMNQCIYLIGVGMNIFSILWAVWRVLDWGNDFYMVTNMRTIWLEKVIGLFESRSEAPLDAVLAVTVFSSLVGQYLDFGSVSVRTYTGKIDMHDMRHPNAFELFIKGYQRRVLVESKETEAQVMEEELEKAIKHKIEVPHETPTVVLPIRTAPPDSGETAKQESYFHEVRRTFLRVRYEENGVVTYRKHWLVLLRKLWLQLLLLFLLVAVTVGWGWLQMNQDEMILSPIGLLLCGGLIYGVVLVWLVYDYLDWNNDIYRLAPNQVFDIERKPLGEEHKKTAPLDSILSVEHERATFIQNIFNYGSVFINVGDTVFDFWGVYNPGQVHQDVVDYREAMMRRKREVEAARERENMIKWLVVYHSQTSDPEIFENPGQPDDN